MMIAGVLIGAETGAMPEELGLEQDYGWMLVLLGALVALAAMVLPVWRSRRSARDGEVDRRSRPDDRRPHLTRPAPIASSASGADWPSGARRRR